MTAVNAAGGGAFRHPTSGASTTIPANPPQTLDAPLMNSPDDQPSERVAKWAMRQCIVLPIVVLVAAAVVLLVMHH
jgi:hypothetical protein